MTKEQKNKWISSGVTAASMTILLLLLVHLGLEYEVPPPPPKKVIFIELSAGGGGGGGATQVNNSSQRTVSGDNIATQNAVEAPSLNSTPKTNANPIQTPKVDERSMYKGGRGGTGSGGEEGSGTGPGKGPGFGPGEDGGSGGNTGYGTEDRKITNKLNLEIENEKGVVYVEVHVNEAGNVLEARIISNNQFPTTITNLKIQADCVARAKTAKYNKGKEELRIIKFQ